jgi:chaperone BCS1
MLGLALAQPFTGSNPSVMDLAVSAIVPDGLPGALLPLYKCLYGLLLKKGKFNISGITTKAIIIIGSITGAKIIWTWCRPILFNTFTSSLRVPQYNKMYPILETYIANRVSESSPRHAGLSSWQNLDGPFLGSGIGESLELEPVVGSGWFRFEGRPIYFEYKKLQELNGIAKWKDANYPVDMVWEEYCEDRNKTEPVSHLQLYCLSSSNAFLFNFLEKIANSSLKMKQKDTEIRAMGKGKKCRSWGWERRPQRPMSTIDLRESVKDTLLKDITRFASRERERWYALRGIPYRRGYLFYGPPGTGKTSTAMALAGMLNFTLWIGNMGAIKDEETLMEVFNGPHKGDILLLEDIDSAGIQRENMQTGKTKKSGISLSTILNAIDGGASKQGVILIMTTNDPESLDPALIRPGRIDLQVPFGNVSQAVAESIFLRMFQDDEVVYSGCGNSRELIDQAKTFSRKVPDGKITPAEVQGFLMNKVTPEAAIIGADKWIEELLLAKAAGKNIVGGYDRLEPTAEEDDAEDPESKDNLEGSESENYAGDSDSDSSYLEDWEWDENRHRLQAGGPPGS